MIASFPFLVGALSGIDDALVQLIQSLDCILVESLCDQPHSKDQFIQTDWHTQISMNRLHAKITGEGRQHGCRH